MMICLKDEREVEEDSVNRTEEIREKRQTGRNKSKTYFEHFTASSLKIFLSIHKDGQKSNNAQVNTITIIKPSKILAIISSWILTVYKMITKNVPIIVL